MTTPTIDALAQRLNQLESNIAGQVNQLGGELTVIKNEMSSFAQYVEREKANFGDLVAAKITEHQQAIELVISECQRKFQETENNLQTLYGGHMNLIQETKSHVDQLSVRIGVLEHKVRQWE